MDEYIWWQTKSIQSLTIATRREMKREEKMVYTFYFVSLHSSFMPFASHVAQIHQNKSRQTYINKQNIQRNQQTTNRKSSFREFFSLLLILIIHYNYYYHSYIKIFRLKLPFEWHKH